MVAKIKTEWQQRENLRRKKSEVPPVVRERPVVETHNSNFSPNKYTYVCMWTHTWTGVNNMWVLDWDKLIFLMLWKRNISIGKKEMKTLTLILKISSFFFFIIYPSSVDCQVAFNTGISLPGQFHCLLYLFLVLILEATNIHFQETNLWKLYQPLCNMQSECVQVQHFQAAKGTLHCSPWIPNICGSAGELIPQERAPTLIRFHLAYL